MIAKVFVFLVAVAAARAVGLGAPLLAAGPLGGVSSQTSAINHVAPAAPLAYAGALGYGAGIAAAPWAYGAGPVGLGHGLAAGNLRADGIVGSGVLGARYGGVIGHNVAGWGLGGLGYGGVLGLGHGGVLGLGHGAGLAKGIW